MKNASVALRFPDGPSALLKASSLLSVVFAGFYLSFVLLAPWIHSFPPPTDPALVTPWLRYAITEHDGSEVYAMMTGVSAVLVLGYFVSTRLRRIPWFRGSLPQVLCIVPALIVLARTNSSNFVPLPGIAGDLAVTAAALSLIGCGYWAYRATAARSWRRRALCWGCWLFAAAFVVLSDGPPRFDDYGYFIGPALKLAAGEKLGTFYLQYNLVGTSLFEVMMAFDLTAHQMQAVLSLLFVLWVWLYWRLAARLMARGYLRFLFVVCLFVVRYLAVWDGPNASPQVGPIRLDLWVPLALVLMRFGYVSAITASAFSLVYVADNVFGLLYFVFYVSALALAVIGDWRVGRHLSLRRSLAIMAPLCGALAFQLLVFGSLTNPAAKSYQGLHIGFLPISTTSMFWGVIWLVTLAIFPIACDPQAPRRRTTLFLYAFAAAQLVYFYGRSHDHNLLNLSGIWVLILFVGLDRLRCWGVAPGLPTVAAGLLICVASVASGKTLKTKLDRALGRLEERQLIETSPTDREIERLAGALAADERRRAGGRVFIFSRFDAYANYRLHLPQVGYFAPFYANVFLEPTAEFVLSLKRSGCTVVLLTSGDSRDLLALNASQSMVNFRQQFMVVSRGQFLEAGLR